MRSSDPNDAGAPVTSAGNAPLHPGDRPPNVLLQGPATLERRISHRSRRRIALVVGFGAAIIGTIVTLGLARDLGLEIPLAAWGGLFLANWIGNGGILVPIPGLRFIGWTMTVHQGTDGAPIIVGLIAGLAMALGQTMYYLGASAGSRHLQEHAAAKPPAPDRPHRIRSLTQRIRTTIEALLRDYGVPTVFSLSAVPNPFTTFASITAGSIGMGFMRFLVSNFAGHVVLGLILALFGTWLTSP